MYRVDLFPESYIRVATVYAANLDLKRANESFAKAEAAERDGDPSARTGFLLKVMGFADTMDENGFKLDAAAIRARYGKEWAAFIARVRAAPPGRDGTSTVVCGTNTSPC
jgi:hypothetical protein